MSKQLDELKNLRPIMGRPKPPEIRSCKPMPDTSSRVVRDKAQLNYLMAMSCNLIICANNLFIDWMADKSTRISTGTLWPVCEKVSNISTTY